MTSPAPLTAAEIAKLTASHESERRMVRAGAELLGPPVLSANFPRILATIAERDARIAELERTVASHGHAAHDIADSQTMLLRKCDDLRVLVVEAREASWDSDTPISPDWDERAGKALEKP